MGRVQSPVKRRDYLERRNRAAKHLCLKEKMGSSKVDETCCAENPTDTYLNRGIYVEFF